MPRKKLVINEEHVMSLKVVGLKKLCTKYKLTKGGRKAVLQDRILEHLQLGKYAVTVVAEQTGETELDKAHSTPQSKPEPKDQQKEQHESKVNLSDETVDSIQSKPVLELEDKPKSEEKLSSGETTLITSESEKGDVISEDVEIEASKVETKFEKLGKLDVVTEETIQNNENIRGGIKRTSSEATISNDDKITEKKRKTTKQQVTEKPKEAIAEVFSKEGLKPEFEIEQKPGDSVSKVSSRSETLEIKPILTDSQKHDDDEDASTQKPEQDIVDQGENLKTKLVEALSKADKHEKAEEVVPKAMVTRQVDKTVAKDTQNDSGLDMKIYETVSKALQSQKSDGVPSKTVESKTEIRFMTEMKKVLTTTKDISSTQDEEKESKSNSDKDNGQYSNQNKKPDKKEETNLRTNQQRRGQERRDQNRNRNRYGRNPDNRNRNRNTGYQQNYRQPRPSSLYSQGGWNSRINPWMANSIPASQQRRNWNSQNIWQGQRPNYYGGYGNDRRRSRDGNWSGRSSGGWQNRRDGRWRDNRRGRRERR